LQRGSSLTNLAASLAIVAVLAVLSGPTVASQARRAWLAEARAVADSWKAHAMGHFATRGSWRGATDRSIGWSPPPSRLWDWTGNVYSPGIFEEARFTPWQPASQGQVLYTLHYPVAGAGIESITPGQVRLRLDAVPQSPCREVVRWRPAGASGWSERSFPGCDPHVSIDLPDPEAQFELKAGYLNPHGDISWSRTFTLSGTILYREDYDGHPYPWMFPLETFQGAAGYGPPGRLVAIQNSPVIPYVPYRTQGNTLSPNGFVEADATVGASGAAGVGMRRDRWLVLAARSGQTCPEGAAIELRVVDANGQVVSGVKYPGLKSGACEE
jgi:hypothetical protein